MDVLVNKTHFAIKINIYNNYLNMNVKLKRNI